MAKIREVVLKSGRTIFLGRDSSTNDELVRGSRKEDLILHTEASGSPFVRVGEDVDSGEEYEAAIVCAKYSQAWRNSKGDVVVNKFFRRDMKKGFFGKEGSWHVKKSEKVKVKKNDILRFEKGL